MYLYHGTSFHHFPSLFYGIDCTNSSNKKDFGKGFYLTPSFPLAVKNAKKAVKFNPDYPVVVSYKLNPEFMEKHFSILIFDQADEDWLGFIISNKSPHATQRIKNGFPNHFTGNYDIIYGPLADGLPNYKKVIRAFESKETVTMLQRQDFLEDIQSGFPFPEYDQFVFRNQKEINQMLSRTKITVLSKEGK